VARRAAEIQRSVLTELAERARVSGAQINLDNGRAVIIGPNGQRSEVRIPVPPAAMPAEAVKILRLAAPRPPVAR
jgi:hypothetical protein